MNNKCNILILSLLAIKLYRFFLAFFVRFWKQMQCIVSQPLPFLVLQNAYLVAKIQIYIGLEQTIILKNIIPQLLFSIILIFQHLKYFFVNLQKNIESCRFKNGCYKCKNWMTKPFGKENVYEDKTFVIFYSCDFFGRMWRDWFNRARQCVERTDFHSNNL